MMETEAEQRARVVAIARQWCGTPYRHHGRKIKSGADCATLIAEVYERAGLVPHQELPPYSPQWHENQHEQLYLQAIRNYCAEVEEPGPGDLAMWKFGHVLSHGAIVVQWPRIIHAINPDGVMLDDALANQRLRFVGVAEADRGKPRERHFYSYWARAGE